LKLKKLQIKERITIRYDIINQIQVDIIVVNKRVGDIVQGDKTGTK
jgi:hypothetical protein